MTASKCEGPADVLQGAGVPNKKLVPNCEETAHHVNGVSPFNERPVRV
ncbi:hypothetical protein [Arthrobacter methylotrophus]